MSLDFKSLASGEWDFFVFSPETSSVSHRKVMFKDIFLNINPRVIMGMSTMNREYSESNN